MYDTIEATIEVSDAIEYDGWCNHRQFRQGNIIRESFELPAARWGYVPYVSYRRDAINTDRGRLSLQMSVAKMVGKTTENVTQADAMEAVRLADVHLSQLGAGLPSVCTWKITRMDYAWNFNVNRGDMSSYLNLFGKLSHAGLDQQLYDEGVTWVRSRRHVAVKFYNKSFESQFDSSVLRYEVSNYDQACRSLANTHDIEQNVQSFLSPVLAKHVLEKHLAKLGLNLSDVYKNAGELIPELHRVFGSTASTALFVLELYATYGNDAYKQGYVAQGTYYKYLKQLRTHGFVQRGEGRTLPALVLPDFESIYANFSSQNVDNFSTGSALTTSKISPENEVVS